MEYHRRVYGVSFVECFPIDQSFDKNSLPINIENGTIYFEYYDRLHRSEVSIYYSSKEEYKNADLSVVLKHQALIKTYWEF